MEFQRRTGRDEIVENFGDLQDTWSVLMMFLERPAACSNDYAIDGVWLIPSDLAIGLASWVPDSGDDVAMMISFLRNSDFGALKVGTATDQSWAFSTLTTQSGASWAGDRIYVPTGQDSVLTMVGRGSGLSACPDTYKQTVDNASDYFSIFAWITPYFRYVR